MSSPSKSVSRWVTPIAWILGLVFLAAAFLKAWDIRQFAVQISYYNLLPDVLELPAAFVMVAVEAFVGISLIMGFQRRWALVAGAALLAVFILATGFRWKELAGHDCGCFGSFDRGGPAAVLWQDSILLVLLIVTFRFRDRVLNLGGRRMAAVLVTLLSLATATYSEMSARSTVAGIDQSAVGQLNIVVYLSSVCPHCMANAERISQIAHTPGLPPIQIYLAADNNSQITQFVVEGHLTASYKPIPFSFLWLMTKSVPVIELRRGETILVRWDGGNMPTPEDVQNAVKEQLQKKS
ncbi:MAG: hypothetical protein PHX83_10290 [Acidobacteriia bacterium]|nr:hypothetical protein [Terriglobia bacterium]